MTSEDVVRRRTVDVRELPSTLFDYHAPIWWGNLLLLIIETTMFGILIATYFSVRMNYSEFPPARVNRIPVLYDSEPLLLIPTITLAVLLLSLIPGILLDIAARKKDGRKVKLFLFITLAFNIAAIVLRFYEFDSLLFRWDDNAYGSVVWMFLGVHLLHMIVLCVEDVFLLVWTFAKGLDEKHALDLTVTAVYWYWIVGIWIFLYALVYFGPRLM